MTNIEDISIFGDYKQAENRITSALLHIFNVGGEELIRFLVNEKLNKIFPSSKIEISAQEKEISSVPDGKLKCSFKFEIFIESKITETIDETQLKNHLKLIDGKEENILLYITKHKEKPKLLAEEVSWSNWNQMLEWINEYIENEGIEEGELLNYLFDNFEKLLRNTNATTEKWDAGSNKRVVIFAGGVWGEDVAKNCKLYFCQYDRSIRPSGYIGFYSKGRIKHCYEINEAPKKDQQLLDYPKLVDYFKTNGFIDDDEKLLNSEFPWIERPHIHQVFKLGPAININTIKNVEKDKNLKPIAYAQGQRYTTYNKIIKAKDTSEL